MAEALGAVASGIAVTQLTVEIGRSIVKLKRLWDEVNEVPETVQFMIDELDLLQLTLRETENDLDEESAATYVPALEPVARHCQSVGKSLSQLANDFKYQITTSRSAKRGLGKLRVALKKDVIQRHEHRLQSAIRLLSLANQEYMKNLMKLQLNAIKSIGTVNRDQPCVYEAAESRTLSGDTDDDMTASERSNMKYPEMLAIKSSLQPGAHEIDQARHHPEKKMASCRNKSRRFRLPFSRWVTTQAWDLMITKSYSGWKLNIQPYMRRSQCMAFDYAMVGENDLLMELFQRGEASPFDRDDRGKNLLFFAIQFSNVDLVKLLVSHGVDAFERGDNGMTMMVDALTSNQFRFQSLATPPKLNIPSSMTSRINRQRCIDFLISEVGLPESSYDKRRLWRFGQFRIEGSALPSELMLDNDPFHYERPLSDRSLRWKSFFNPWVRWSPCMISSFLWQDGRPRKEDIMCSLTGPISILHWISFHAGMGIEGGEYLPLSILPAWPSFLPKVLGLCQTDEPHHVLPPQTLHCRDCAGWPLGWIRRYSTALFEFLYGVWSQRVCSGDEAWNPVLKRGLQMWLNIIKEVYHLDSLENYGRREYEVMEQFLGRAVWDAQLNLRGLDCPAPILIGIKYGARVHDWEIEWDMQEERFVGEFWQLVESQLQLEAIFELPTGMPGSWVEEAPTPSGPVPPSLPEVGDGLILGRGFYIRKTGTNEFYEVRKASDEGPEGSSLKS